MDSLVSWGLCQVLSLEHLGLGSFVKGQKYTAVNLGSLVSTSFHEALASFFVFPWQIKCSATSHNFTLGVGVWVWGYSSFHSPTPHPHCG